MTAQQKTQLAHQLRYVSQVLHEHMAIFGYEELLLPIIEPAEIFLTRAGDTIIDRLFTFERSGKQRALRPEFTASAAYLYGQQAEQKPVRWQFSGAIFEDQTVSGAKQYERTSIGAEYIGQPGIAAEAEIISMAILGLEKLGIQNWNLSIGHVGLQMHLLAQHQLDSRLIRAILSQREILRTEDGIQQVVETLRSTLPQLSEDHASEYHADDVELEHMLDVLLTSTGYGNTLGGRTRQDIAQRMIDKRMRIQSLSNVEEALRQFQQWSQIRQDAPAAFDQVESLIAADDETGNAWLDDWRSLFDLVKTHGISERQIQIQADLTRHWEYYTGIVFGIWSADGTLLAAGGRYDDLAQLLGNDKPIPAVGFAYYVDALLDALSVVPPYPNVLTFDPADLPMDAAIESAMILRKRGFSVAITHGNAEATLIGEEDNIRYHGNRYTLNNIDALITDLKAALA